LVTNILSEDKALVSQGKRPGCNVGRRSLPPLLKPWYRRPFSNSKFAAMLFKDVVILALGKTISATSLGILHAFPHRSRRRG
jgi:hypothetical protein